MIHIDYNISSSELTIEQSFFATVVVKVDNNEVCLLESFFKNIPSVFDNIIVISPNRIDIGVRQEINIINVNSTECVNAKDIYLLLLNKVKLDTKWICFLDISEVFNLKLSTLDKDLNNNDNKIILLYKILTLDDFYYKNIRNEKSISVDNVIYNTEKCSIQEILNNNIQNLLMGKHSYGKALLIKHLTRRNYNKLDFKAYRIDSIFSLAAGYDSYEKMSEHELRQIILNKIDLISRTLNNNVKGRSEISLYSGVSGIILYLSQLYIINKDEKIRDIIHDLLDVIKSNFYNQVIYSSFCSGLAGYAWLIAYLNKKGIIEIEDDYFEEIEMGLVYELKRCIHDNNFDQLHGAISIARYFLSNRNEDVLNLMLTALSFSKVSEYNEVKWSSYNNATKGLKYDFGLAHGMAGVLYFIMKCYECNINQSLCTNLIDGILNFYKNNEQNYSKCGSFYPAYVDVKDYFPTDRLISTRLAWCYGDIGILYSIYIAGMTLNRDDIKRYAKERLSIIAGRINTSHAKVYDACFCHGSSSIAYMFMKLYKFTKESCFYNAAIYWYKVSVVCGRNINSSSGYYFLTEINNDMWVEDDSLLQGISGVGLSLLSFIYDDYSSDWDECMMLS